MPNWCYNKLTVSHEDESKILDLVNDDFEFTMEKLLPVKQWATVDEQRDAWWCKWGAVNANITDRTSHNLEVFFDTAWCPPDKFYRKLHELWYQFNAVWMEETNDYLYKYTTLDKLFIDISYNSDEIFHYELNDDFHIYYCDPPQQPYVEEITSAFHDGVMINKNLQEIWTRVHESWSRYTMDQWYEQILDITDSYQQWSTIYIQNQ